MSEMSIFLHDWTDADDVMRDFEIKAKDMDGVEILLASYTYENWEGDAFVLFRRDGVLYEVNGSHCSCYGLEGQWEPEETTIAVLRHRLTEGHLGRGWFGRGNIFADELAAVLDRLEAKSVSKEATVRSIAQPLVITVRPEVAAFAVAMERKLAANDHKPHWRRYSAVQLLTRLFDEFLELQEAVDDGVPYEVRAEAVDVGNFAMMLWDVAGGSGDGGGARGKAAEHGPY